MKRLLLPVELQSQVVTQGLNNTMTKEHAGTPNDGVHFNGRPSVQQTTADHHQGTVSQWPAAQNTSSYFYYMSVNTSQQNPFMQMETPLPPNGLQVNCNQGNLYQDSQLINSHPPQSSLQKPKADYFQQNVAAQWKPQGANRWTQYNNLVPKRSMKESHSSRTGMTTKPGLPSSTTRTSLPHQQRVNMGQCESSLTHNNKVIYNHCNVENNTQQAMGYYHRPHSYIAQSQQPSGDNHLVNMPIQQGTHVSCVSQRTQQHPAQLSPTFHSKEANTQSDKDKAISRIIDSLQCFCPVNQDVCSTANNSSLYRGVHSSITTQPVPTNASNTHQSLVIIPGGTLSEYVPVISPPEDMAGSSQKPPFVPHKVLNVSMIDQNKSLGKEVRNSQSPEAPLSTTEEECTVNSPSGHTNTKAIAVVQPLSPQSCQVPSSHEAFDTVGFKTADIRSPGSLQEVSEKTVSAQELRPRLAGKTSADQHEGPMSPPADVSRSQSCESGDDPEASISKSSSAPTVNWTIQDLQKLIENEEAAQQKYSDLVDGRIKLWQLFRKSFRTYEARKDLFHLFVECKRFMTNHVTPDTVMTQLKPGGENQEYQILRDNSLYTEPPFRSTWLNIEQLDDIDKEFGFPPCLRHTRIQKMDSQWDLATAARGSPEATEKDLKQTEPKLGESDVEKQGESSPIRDLSPDHTQDGDSPDPCYSFKIRVLSPEEAKLIYKCTESPERHSEGAHVENQDSAHHQPEKDASVAADVPVLTVAQLNETDCPIEEVCCLSRLVGNIFESSEPLVKCQCGVKQSVKAVIDITESDSDDSVTEIGEVIILTENQKDNPPGTDYASVYPKIDSVYTQADSESIQSIFSAAYDSRIENPSGSDAEISSLIWEGKGKKLSDVSSVETKEQTPVSTKTAPLQDVNLTGTSKKESKPEARAVSPVSKESSWCKLASKVESQLSTGPEVPVELAGRNHLDSDTVGAHLVLFGSVQKGTGKTYERKRHFSSEGAVCTSSKPPEVLSVMRQFSETLPVQEKSVKNKIFEIWRESFPVKPLKRRGKNTERSPFSLGAQEKQPGSPEKTLKLLNPSLRTSDGSQCKLVTKCISPGEL